MFKHKIVSIKDCYELQIYTKDNKLFHKSPIEHFVANQSLGGQYMYITKNFADVISKITNTQEENDAI